MGDDQLEVGVFLEDAAHHHPHGGQGGVEHEGHAGDQWPVVDAVHVDGRSGVHVHGDTKALDMLVDRPELLAVEGLLVDVGEEINALEPQVFNAPVDLGDGAFGGAPAQGGPGLELAGVGLDHFGQMVVDARGPVVGFRAAQQFRAGHAVAEDGHADTQVSHVLQFLVDVCVDQGRGVLVAASAANEVGAAPKDSLGQGSSSRQILKIRKVDQVAMDIYAHGGTPSERYQLSAISGRRWLVFLASGQFNPRSELPQWGMIEGSGCR